MAKIAEEVGVCPGTVGNHLTAQGVQRQKRTRRLKLSESQRAEIEKLYLAEVRASDIGPRFNIHPTSVYAVLKQRGVPVHNPGNGRPTAVGATNINKSGYVLEKVDRSWKFWGLMAGQGAAGTWIMQHRKVMAEHLNRALLASEQVHHINGLRSDNRLENLQLVQGAHGSGVQMRCQCCGSTDIKATELSREAYST
jgi:hypothetical protein